MPVLKPSNQTITVGAASNTTLGTSGTQNISNVVIAGAGNVSVGVTNGSIVVSGTQTQSIAPAAISAGTTLVSSGTVVLSNANGVSFGANGNTITASYTIPTQSVQTQNLVSVLGSTGNISFANGNNVTFGGNASTITASVPAGATATGNFGALGAGAQTATSGTVILSNANGVSFGLNNGTITASYTVPTQTVQTQNLVSVLGSTGNISFANGNNVTFGGNANTITASFSYSQSTAPAAISAGTTRATNGTVVLADGNGISFGLNGNTVTASYTVPTQSNQTIGAYAAGNTTGQSSSSTFDARTLSISGAGIVSVGYSGNNVIISATGGGGAGGVALGAGTQTATSGTIVLSNSNGISFGLSGSTRLTASVDGIKSVSAGTTRITNGEAVFSNSNGVSFGVNGNTITASYTVPTQSVQTQNLVSILGSTGNISLVNGNGVTFGGNASTVTASVGAGATATGNFGALGAGTQTATSGTVAFANSNGISFGMSGSNQITASYTVPTQSAQTIGGYAVGNTTGQSSSSTFDARTLSLSGAGIVSVGYSGNNVIISAVAAGAGDGVNIIAAGTQTATTNGTVLFADSNGVSFGLSGSTRITASIPAGATATGNLGALSAGTTQATNGTVVLSNSNGISFGLNGGTVTASYTVPTQSVQTQNLVSVLGSTGNISFVNGNNVTFGGNASTITASIPAGATATGNFGALGAGTQTATSGTVAFANSNGISFGMSGSNQITASYSQSTAPGAISAGTTQATNGTVVLSNSNGISFGLNGNTVTASYTVPAQTVQTQNLVSILGSTGNISFANANNVTFGGNASTVTASIPAGATATGNFGALGAGTQTATSGTVSFANSNGISFGMSGSNQITASYTVPTQTNQTIGGYAVGNTTGQSSSSTFDARTLSLSGAGIVSVGYSGNNVIISAVAAGGGDGVNIIAAGTQTATTNGTVLFADSNGVSFGLSGSTRVTASIPAGATATGNLGAVSAGTTQATNGTVVLSNSNGISFGLNGNTVTASYTVPTQSVQTQNLVSILGSTGNISFANGNGVTFGGNASTVTASVGAGATATGNFGALGAGTQTATSGTVSFANSNGISFGMSGSNQITASYTVPTQSVQTIGGYAVGNTTGQSSSSTFDARTLSLSGAGIVSVGYSGNNVIISATAAGGGGGGIAAAAGTQTATSGTIVFANSNGLSFGMSNSSQITASYDVSQLAAGANITITTTGSTMSVVGNNPLAITAGTNSKSSGTVVFSNSNGVSFGMATDGVITASFSGGGGGGGGIAAGAGTQTATSGTIVFANSNGMTFGMSNSSQITASYDVSQLTAGANITLNNAGSTVSIVGNNPLAITAGTNSKSSGTITFANSNGISFGMSTDGVITASHNALTSQSNQAVSGANGSFTFQTLTFANSNGISWSTGTQGLYASHNGITSQSNQQLSLYAAGNTTQSSSGTVNASSILFNGAGIASVGVTNGSVLISVPAGGGGGDGVNIVRAGTAGTTGTTWSSLSGTVNINGSNGIVVSQNNSNDIVIGEVFTSDWVPYFPGQSTSQTLGAMGVSTASAFFFPLSIGKYVAFNHINIINNYSFATSTVSGQQSITSQWGLYSYNNSTLSIISSSSFSMAVTNSGASATVSFPTSTNPSGYTYNTSSASTTALLQSYFGSAGLKLNRLVFGDSMSLSPGIYWLGIHQRMSSSSANIGINGALHGIQAPQNNVGFIGQASSAQTTNFIMRDAFAGLGVYTSTGSAGYGGTALPSSVFMSGIAHTLTMLPTLGFHST